jgi:hypothetical protein
MNKDELLKIYSAYMPYKTPITLASEAYNYDGLTTILSPHYLLDWQRNKCKISLHLWDLSYLTKEIEHEGKMITPIVEIMNGGDDIFEDMLIRLAAGLSNPDRLPYRIFIKLLSYHFNVFQLSEDQFISKATLTNK